MYVYKIKIKSETTHFRYFFNLKIKYVRFLKPFLSLIELFNRSCTIHYFGIAIDTHPLWQPIVLTNLRIDKDKNNLNSFSEEAHIYTQHIPHSA